MGILGAVVAQLAEQLIRNEQVAGSIPVNGSIRKSVRTFMFEFNIKKYQFLNEVDIFYFNISTNELLFRLLMLRSISALFLSSVMMAPALNK